MKHFSRFIFTSVLLAIALLTACEEHANNTTLKLRFLPESARSVVARDPISPEGEGLAITNYVITGDGPNGKTFTITTSSAQAEINGLVIGTWQIDVVGSNQQGTILATGTATHHLTTRDNLVEVFLDEYEGEGTVEVDFAWGDTEFSNISLDLKLRPQGGEQTTITTGKTIDAQSASARYVAVLPTGSYDLTFTLFSDTVKIGGGIVALRILDGKLSARTIPIIVDKITPEATGLTITSRVSDPVVGEIIDIGETILPNTEVAATFRPSGGGDDTTIQVDWYLDGTFLSSGDTVSFATFTGAHRLDAITRTESLGSVGSETHPFFASVEELHGVPHTVDAIIKGENDPKGAPFWLDTVSDIAFLRDGNLIIASAAGLQICAINKDKLYVKNSIPSLGITHIEVDAVDDIVCTTDTTMGIIEFYRYDPATVTLHKYASFEPDTEAGNIWTPNITNAVLDRSQNYVYFAEYVPSGPYSGSYIYYAPYTKNYVGQFNEGEDLIAAPGYPDVIDITSIAINDGGTRIAVTSPSTRSFHTYSISDGFLLEKSISYDGHYSETSPSLEGPFSVSFTGDYIEAIMGDGIHLFSRTGQLPYWVHEGKPSSRNDPVSAMIYDVIGMNGWAIHGGSTPAIYHMSLVSNVPVYSTSPMLTGSFIATDICYSPMGNFLSISGGDELWLLRVSDD